MDNNRLTKKDILSMFSIERTTLHNWIKNKIFPEPSIKLSTHKCYWLSEDIDKFFNSKKNGE